MNDLEKLLQTGAYVFIPVMIIVAVIAVVSEIQMPLMATVNGNLVPAPPVARVERVLVRMATMMSLAVFISYLYVIVIVNHYTNKGIEIGEKRAMERLRRQQEEDDSRE